jgi:hypothetical protein
MDLNTGEGYFLLVERSNEEDFDSYEMRSVFEGISVASGEGNIRNGQSSVDSSTMREKIESDPVNDNLNW